MILAVNYSRAAVELLQAGRIAIDRFKCPAWPELVAEAQAIHPVYVHFPLAVAPGGEGILSSETLLPPDWSQVERLLHRTSTPFVNLHLMPAEHRHPGAPTGLRDPDKIEAQAEDLASQLQPAITRFGADQIILENCTALWPEAIHAVVEAAGCGFLFDVAHAVLAADRLRMDLAAYAERLPLQHTREIHITGVRRLAGRWVDIALRTGWARETDPIMGRLIDHLPMSSADWKATAWCLDLVQADACGAPWSVTFEYGGVGGFLEAVTDIDSLAADVPRLLALVRDAAR